MSAEAKCPFQHSSCAVGGTTNRDWWPKQLRLELLHQHSAKSNPMGEDFDYAKEFQSLDLAAVKRDLAALMTITMIGLMCAHVCEIALWAAFYQLTNVKTDFAGAFEFAFENYTALGYGDQVPPEGRRLVGPIAALNGLLLIGWSVAIIFEVMRMAEVQFARLGDKDES